MREVFLGIDCATESMRGSLIDETGTIQARFTSELEKVSTGLDGRITQNPQSWKTAIDDIISRSFVWADSHGCAISSLSISATSGTFALVDSRNQPVANAAMYNDGRADNPISRAIKIVEEVGPGSYHLAHTPEFLVAHLSGMPVESVSTDWSHALKTGIDLSTKTWLPEKVESAKKSGISLPNVVSPGFLLGKMAGTDIPIYSGMTDGCTAQISVGSAVVGSAVTTLGTTMVIKVISDHQVVGNGFYSHLLPDNRWLSGGASNLGGISFSRFATDISRWDKLAEEYGPSSIVSYPIPGTGERFPISNRQLSAISSGTPKNEVDEYRSILEGIAFAERLAYETLTKAGAPQSAQVFTVGGGSKSAVWNAIRATILQRSISTVGISGSDIGAAMIARAALAGGDLSLELDKFNSSTAETIHPDTRTLEFYENRYQDFLQLVNPFISQ
jgi:sugar (pentulose or hexulose) kinase